MQAFYKLIFLVFLTLSFSCKDKSESTPSGPKFEPPDGSALFILGQSHNSEMSTYISSFSRLPVPAGFSYYTNLNYGIPNADVERFEDFCEQYPNTVLQVAIWTGGDFSFTRPGYYLDEIVRGEKDQGIRQLAETVKNLDRPVFIRFGYEFDGRHNAYPPEKYKAAYRYFVDKMREWGVSNVAYVWHSWGVTPYYGTDEFPEEYPALPEGQTATYDLWYPGDEYVDWTAISIFGTGWGNLLTNSSIQSFIELSKTHDKPIMISEAAAIKTSNTIDRTWRIPNANWFNNVFALMNAHPEIKVLTYINVDWTEHNPNDTWGNTRIQAASSDIIDVWVNGVSRFDHASDSLYERIGYK